MLASLLYEGGGSGDGGEVYGRLYIYIFEGMQGQLEVENQTDRRMDGWVSWMDGGYGCAVLLRVVSSRCTYVCMYVVVYEKRAER